MAAVPGGLKPIAVSAVALSVIVSWVPAAVTLLVCRAAVSHTTSPAALTLFLLNLLVSFPIQEPKTIVTVPVLVAKLPLISFTTPCHLKRSVPLIVGE